MQTVHYIPLSVSTRPVNYICQNGINDRTFITFRILLCLYAFSLDGSSLQSIIGGCKGKPNSPCAILLSLL